MFSFQSKVRYSEVDSKKRMTELALMDYFQDCSVFQSEKLEIGLEYLRENHLAWILLAWQIRIEQMPLLSEVIEIQTWPYDMKGFCGYRNFSMNNLDGKCLACANSVWVLMDTESGRPEKVPEIFRDIYGMEEQIPLEELDHKIKPLPGGEDKHPVVVPPYFIDTNQHMNNSKYLLIAEEFLPADFKPRDICVEYRKAALLGDIIHPVVALAEDIITVELNDENKKPYATLEFRR